MKKQTTNRHILKKMRSHSKEKLHNDPRFKKLRENWNDFTTAAKAAKLMRTVMENIQEPVHDRRRHTMLTKIFNALLKTDKTSAPGQRCIANTELSTLECVELNTGIYFDELFSFSRASIETNRTTGQGKITLLYDNINRNIHPMKDATHFEVQTGFAEIDFEKEIFHLNRSVSIIRRIDNKRNTELQFDLEMGQDSNVRWYMFVAVNFYNKKQRLKEGAVKLIGILEAERSSALLVGIPSTAFPQTQHPTQI